MLEQQQRVADASRAPFLDQFLLQLQRLVVRDVPEAPDVHTQLSSKFCSRFFSACRNRPASAPSISR